MADASTQQFTTQVLVLDGRAAMRDAFRDVLELSGCQVAEAASLDEALGLLARHPVQVVVVADTPGHDLTTAIRASGRMVRIVSVCGTCATQKPCGADTCLVGQFSARELTAAVAG